MTKKLSASSGRNDGQPIDNEPDVVDPIPHVAKRWNLSVDSIYRAAARGDLKITTLGPRRKGLRRSEQRRYLDTHTA
jgi:hypothetical protein